MVTINGANHINLVDRQEDTLQASVVILKAIEAVHSGQPLR